MSGDEGGTANPWQDLPAILEMQGISKNFNGITALNDFNLEVRSGEIVGLIGPNGAGKTTLFNILTGFLPADSGQIVVRGRVLKHHLPQRVINLGIARTFQNLRLINGMTALENVLLGITGQAGENLLRLLIAPRHIAGQERQSRERAMDCLRRVGLEYKAGDLTGRLSYGQRKLLSLAVVLATGAEILLLDEPVAGVQPRIIERILAEMSVLADEGRTLIVIEHNTRAIERLADRLVFMDHGRKVAEGPPAEVLGNQQVLEAYLV